MVALRVVSFNVRALRDDRAAVVRTLRSLDADIACLQEVPRFVRWRSRNAALARESNLLYAGGGGTTGGTAMYAAVRVDVRDVREYRLSRTPGLHRRGAVGARVHKAGASAVVAAFHLGLDAEERGRHRSELLSFVDRYGDGTVVLAGDVNEPPDHPTWQSLAAELTDAGAGDKTPTFPTPSPRHRIDGIFVRGARITSYQVFDGPDVRAASDHHPVVADLEL